MHKLGFYHNNSHWSSCFSAIIVLNHIVQFLDFRLYCKFFKYYIFSFLYNCKSFHFLPDCDHLFSSFAQISNCSLKPFTSILQIKNPQKFATLISLSLSISDFTNTQKTLKIGALTKHTLYLFLRLMILTDNSKRHRKFYPIYLFEISRWFPDWLASNITLFSC